MRLIHLLKRLYQLSLVPGVVLFALITVLASLEGGWNADEFKRNGFIIQSMIEMDPNYRQELRARAFGLYCAIGMIILLIKLI